MNNKKWVRKAFIAAFWILLWWGLSLVVNNDILIVSPLRALCRLMSLLREGTVVVAAGRTLCRIALGFTGGFLAAILLAVAAARCRLAEELLAPLMGVLTAVPVASFVVLLLIWWGSSFLAVTISFLIVLPMIYSATLQGIRSVDKRLLEMARVFRIPFRHRLVFFYLPALKPYLFSSLKVALGMSWKSGVAAEVIGVPAQSVGEQMYLSKVYLDTAGLFAWTVVAVLLSFLFEKAVFAALQRLFALQPYCSPDHCAPDRQMRAGTSGRRKRDGSSPSVPKDSVSAGEVSPEIRLCNLEKSFGAQGLFRVEECVLKPGMFYRLDEPSGSGKTTFLRMLAGLESFQGTIECRGVTSPGKSRELPRCAMCFQEDRLCEEATAVQNVAMVLGDVARAREALLQVLEPEALDKPCALLSGGMRRRVAVVRAMEAEAQLVLLDEPYNGLDEDNIRKLRAYILSRQRGRTILIASHI